MACIENAPGFIPGVRYLHASEKVNYHWRKARWHALNSLRVTSSCFPTSLACSEMWVKMRPEQGKRFGEDWQITWEFTGRLAPLRYLRYLRYLSRRALEGRLRVPQNPQHPPACCVCLRLGHRAMAQQTG